MNIVDANKLERRHEKEIKDFILKKVLNQDHLHTIKGLTCAKDFQKNYIGNRKKNRLANSMNVMKPAMLQQNPNQRSQRELF